MAATVEAIVPPDGIILTQRLDKVFFPERRVIALEGMLGDDRQAIELVAAHGSDYKFYFIDALTNDEDSAAHAELMKQGIEARFMTALRGDSVRLYELTVRK